MFDTGGPGWVGVKHEGGSVPAKGEDLKFLLV